MPAVPLMECLFREILATDEVMRTARAFTLLEMLIVLALLAALGALVLPALSGRIGGASASAAAEEMVAAAGMARARAVARGRPVALVAATHPEPDRHGGTGSAGRGVRLFADELEPDALAASNAGDSLSGAALSAAAELLAELPRGCVVERSAPAADEATGADTTEAAPEETGDAPSILQLAVFLPDGSPLRPQPAYLRTPVGMVYRLDLGPSSGRATVTAVDLTADAMSDVDVTEVDVPLDSREERPR